MNTFGPQKGPSSVARINAQHKQLTRELQQMNAFITGSHAYGKPTENSDVDLVVFMSTEWDANKIKRYFGDPQTTHGGPVRAGNLNLILCDTEAEWSIWRYGTDILIRRSLEEGRPVDTEEATELFDSLRAAVNIKSERMSK